MIRNILIHHNTFADLSVNDEITENGIYVYLCLKPLVNPNWTYLHTTVKELNSVLSDTDISKRPKQQNIIKQGLKELETANYIKVLSSKKNNFEFELDLDGMVEEYSKDNHYTVFEIEQLKQVLKDNKGFKLIFKYLSDYFYFLTHNDNGIDEQEKEMCYFQEERTAFADECELDVRTFDKYNDILMKNEIIYIHKHDYKYTDSNKQVPNAYGLYKNKDIIDSKCNDYLNEHKDDNKSTYTKESKFFVCKTPRLCKYLQEKGFTFNKCIPDRKNPFFNVWIFTNSDDLYEVVSDYFVNKKYYR